MNTCSADLAAQSRALNLHVVDEMYRDPFWSERCGDHGRRFAEQVGQHHLTNLTHVRDLAMHCTDDKGLRLLVAMFSSAWVPRYREAVLFPVVEPLT